MQAGFLAPNGRRVGVDPISPLDATWLDRKFEVQEVKQIISDMEGDKAPGLMDYYGFLP